MNITINRSILADALASVAAVIPTRSPKPVLSCVKIEAAKDAITLTCTDLELTIARTVPADEAEGDAILVDAAKLLSIATTETCERLTLRTSGSELRVDGDTGTYKLFTQPASEFPPTPNTLNGVAINFDAGELHRLASATSYAVAQEGTRYAFNGVKVETDGKAVSFVATDGRRLAVVNVPKKSAKGSAIIPPRVFNVATKVGSGSPWTLTIGDNQAELTTDGATIRTNILEGTFPAWREVVPSNEAITITIKADAEELASAVRRASLLTSDDSKGVRFDVGNGIAMSSRNPESGEAKVDLACQVDGGTLAIGINPKFVLDALKPVDGELSFRMSTANRPVLIESGDYRAVIMPVNLQ